MEKVGKAPKERLFFRDVGMSDASVLVFLERSHTFLSLIADVSFLYIPKNVFKLKDSNQSNNKKITHQINQYNK